MKTKLIIGGIALAMTSMGNAKLPYLDPTHLPTLGSLISALNYGWADSIDEISAQTVQAETHASNAEAHANNAETAAKTASNKADTAITTANDANTIAQQAATKVASFDTRLINAESDATSAQQIASSANEQAKGATQTAQTASTKVDSYDSRVSAAESKATEAKQIADTAKQTADGIKATADAAKAAADKASEAATTATETANTAKQTADSAKASADKVDQFDQRLSTAESNAKDARNASDKASTTADKASTAADKAMQFVNELDQKYDTKVKDLSTRVDTAKKQSFTVEDRVIYGHKGQSLQDLIAIAQNDPNISPKLDADHPVVIKLAPIEYRITSEVTIPAGLVMQGENQAILHFYPNGYLMIGEANSFENLKVLVAEKADYGRGLVRVKTENLTPKPIYFNHVVIDADKEGDNFVFILRDTIFTDKTAKLKLYFNNVTAKEGLLLHGKNWNFYPRDLGFFLYSDDIEINNSELNKIGSCTQYDDYLQERLIPLNIKILKTVTDFDKEILSTDGFCPGFTAIASYTKNGKLIG